MARLTSETGVSDGRETQTQTLRQDQQNGDQQDQGGNGEGFVTFAVAFIVFAILLFILFDPAGFGLGGA